MFINNCSLKQYGTIEIVFEWNGIYYVCAVVWLFFAQPFGISCETCVPACSLFFFFGHPFEVIARIFFIFGAIEEQSIFILSFFLDFAYGARGVVRAVWFCKGFDIAPSPERARFCFIGAYEEGSSIVSFQEIFNHAHFREFSVFVANGLFGVCGFPCGDGFFEQFGFVFWSERAEEVTATRLITEPERSVFSSGMSTRFSV